MCKHDVWVTLESLKAAEGYDVRFICEVCLDHCEGLGLEDSKIKMPTEGQMREIRNALH